MRPPGYRRDAYAVENEREGEPFPRSGNLRFLRAPQLRALETYWYLRLVENTPRIGDLYARLFVKPSERRKALGLDTNVFAEIVEDEGIESLLRRIKEDDAFVEERGLEALRESLFLDYPSYIFALAIPAGLTLLARAPRVYSPGCTLRSAASPSSRVRRYAAYTAFESTVRRPPFSS
ncbi:MAG: hypothetical protein ACRDF0_05570 [Candidatus Limnocylindria bacterium]